MKPGSVMLFSNRNFHILSWGQKFFTRQPWTHTAVVIPSIWGQEAYLGADLTVDVLPYVRIFENSKYDYCYFEPTGFTNAQIKDAGEKTFVKFAGMTYGFAQLLWFIERWFMWGVFKKDIRKWRNHFPDGPICSEVMWWYLWYLGEYAPELRTLLDDWRPDTFHSGDTAYVVDHLSNLFTWGGGRISWAMPHNDFVPSELR